MNPNPQQEKVIQHKDGPCLVTAVPGSGKTACLTARVNALLKSGVDPSSILAITFTNKAAKEMRTRVSAKVGEELARQMSIGTFHGMCARLIRMHAELVGMKRNFTILDRSDQERMLVACFCKVLNCDKKSQIPKKDYLKVYSYLEKTRNGCIDDGDRGMLPEKAMYDVVDEYYDALSSSNSIDFTGLLHKAYELFKNNPSLLSRYQDKWLYISVDEAQDTNVAQYEVVKMLAGKHRNILMVGDTDQGIYAFRGARPENIFTFEKDFAPLVLKLETNYRSTPQILSSAQSLIERNVSRKKTVLRTGNEDGREPAVFGSQTDVAMADKVASYVDRRIGAGVPPSEVALLYRIKSASRVLEQALRGRGIKYKVIGGVSFYERKEVKGCLAILRLMSNNDDRMAFETAVDFCCKGVGGKSLSKIASLASTHKISTLRAAAMFASEKGKQPEAMRKFLRVLSGSNSAPPGEALLRIAKQTSFWKSMEADSTAENDRCGNIMEMGRDVGEYLSRHPGRGLERYLQDVSLFSSADSESDDGRVNLMTMHAAKGLEFDVVAITHVNEGILPHQNCLSVLDRKERARQIEEERRLLYVAMTRARKWLRMDYCVVRHNARLPMSRFLPETGVPISGS